MLKLGGRPVETQNHGIVPEYEMPLLNASNRAGTYVGEKLGVDKEKASAAIERLKERARSRFASDEPTVLSQERLDPYIERMSTMPGFSHAQKYMDSFKEPVIELDEPPQASYVPKTPQDTELEDKQRMIDALKYQQAYREMEEQRARIAAANAK